MTDSRLHVKIRTFSFMTYRQNTSCHQERRHLKEVQPVARQMEAHSISALILNTSEHRSCILLNGRRLGTNVNIQVELVLLAEADAGEENAAQWRDEKDVTKWQHVHKSSSKNGRPLKSSCMLGPVREGPGPAGSPVCPPDLILLTLSGKGRRN
ncbi:hypothetical protein NQZ68_007091 [Dissostichus eleginoides]|nr:hypothetical protein NQZ68_007091 [Dissostichus eleginoides]